MPSARCRPVPLSPICAPVTSGGPSRKPVVEADAARALGDVLVDLAVLVGAGAEALDRGIDHARVELLDALPGEPHAIERAGREVLDQHVAFLHRRSRISMPFLFLLSMVIERLLWFSIVK